MQIFTQVMKSVGFVLLCIFVGAFILKVWVDDAGAKVCKIAGELCRRGP